MKNFNIMGGSLKILIFMGGGRGGSQKTNIWEGIVFLRKGGVDTLMHTMV